MDDDFDSGLDFSDSMDTGSSDMGDFDVGSFMDETPEMPEMEDFSDVGGFEEESFDVGSFMDESAMDMPDPVEDMPPVEGLPPETVEEYEPEVEIEELEEMDTPGDYPEEIETEQPMEFDIPPESVEEVPEDVEIIEEPVEETVEEVVEEAEPVADEPPVELEEPVADEPPAELEEPVADEPPVEFEEPVADEPPVEFEELVTDEQAREFEETTSDDMADENELEESLSDGAEPEVDIQEEDAAGEYDTADLQAVDNLQTETVPVAYDTVETMPQDVIPDNENPETEDVGGDLNECPLDNAPPPSPPPSGPPDDLSEIPEETGEKHYDTLYEYLCDHNYGKEDYDTYSKDPEWQRLNNEYLIQTGREPIDYSTPETVEAPESTAYDGIGPGPAQTALGEYLAEHNYGREDYEIYSKDPEWQQLNNDFLQETGREPIDYSVPEAELNVSDIQNDVLIEVITEEIPAEVESVGVDTTESIPDTVLPVTVETVDTVAEPEMPERELDEFETTVAMEDADFYESGSFYTQGINEYGYTGTCGETSMANTMNRVLGTNEYTENKVLDVAVQEGLCDTSSYENSGGTTTDQFMELYERMNETCGDQLDVELTEFNNVLSMEEAAQRLEEGCTLNVAVDSRTLWDEVDPMGTPFVDSRATDHWITVTGVQRAEDGSILGFDVVDSGGGINYVDADKYQAMCYGTDNLELTDPTCIVVSKADGVADASAVEAEPVRLDDTQSFDKDDELYEQFESEPEDSDRSFNLLREIYKIFKH